jgi:hypothetical protein
MAHHLMAPAAAVLLLLVAGCSSNDNANNTMNVDENLTTTDMNATDMNAVDTNAVDMNAATNAVAEVRPGRGNFTKPPPMEVGAGWYTIEFHSGPNEQTLSEQAQGAQATPSQPIHVSRHMKVTLQPDPNFLIKPKSDEDQDTGADLAATWDWSVKPLSEGEQTLIAHVQVMMPDSHGNLATYDQYDSHVAVRVTVGSWQGLLNALGNAKSLGDALTLLFKSWRGTLLALAALMVAVGVVIGAIRGRRPPADSGEKETDA